MRKITEVMATAFLNGQSKKMGNTMVTVDNGISKMYLHGNLIAIYDFKNSRDFSISPTDYYTNTTKERLNGILEVAGHTNKIYQSMGVWYIDIDDKHIFVTDDWHGYRHINK